MLIRAIRYAMFVVIVFQLLNGTTETIGFNQEFKCLYGTEANRNILGLTQLSVTMSEQIRKRPKNMAPRRKNTRNQPFKWLKI